MSGGLRTSSPAAAKRRVVDKLPVGISYQPPSSKIPTDGITNTKLAVVLYTLGVPLEGVYITYDADHPGSSGGVAHFIFESSESNPVQKYLAVYNESTADVELDDYLETLEVAGHLTAELRAELEKKFSLALIVYGRKFLDGYTNAVRDLKDKIAKYVVTGGEPAYHEGKMIGTQNFTVMKLK